LYFSQALCNRLFHNDLNAFEDIFQELDEKAASMSAQDLFNFVNGGDSPRIDGLEFVETGRSFIP